jgi:hypothetical protein
MERFEAPVDIRRFLPDLRTDSLFEVAPTITLSLRRLRGVDPVTSGFWTLARALKTDMDRKIDRLDSTVYNNFLGWNICMTRTTEWSFTDNPSARACRFR